MAKKPVRYCVVDAFTDSAFKGNPAAVCLLEEDRDEKWLQAVAREFNISKTCFLTRLPESLTGAIPRFLLRWFTPVAEGGTQEFRPGVDYTRSLWTFLMPHKTYTPSILERFFNLISTQFDTKIKIVRSDNGTEFLNHQCAKLFSEKGVIHQTSCSYTPQQNGVVEIRDKILLQIARALMYHSHLPIHFWGDAILTATYIINRLPSMVLHWKSPFELLFNTTPNYDFMKCFGCLCYAVDTTPHKDKFAPRSHKCVFLGYGVGKRGYKLYNLDTKVTFVSRDVKFYENIFPFSTSDTSGNHTVNPPFTSTDLTDFPSFTNNNNLSSSDSLNSGGTQADNQSESITSGDVSSGATLPVDVAPSSTEEECLFCNMVNI